MAFIVDASVALSWLFTDEFTKTSQSLLSRAVTEEIFVPVHWRAEIANGALTGERRGRLPPGTIERWLGRLNDIHLEYDEAGVILAFETTLPIARQHRLTIYDSLYLELALRRNLALATFDKALGDAARSVGVEVIA